MNRDRTFIAIIEFVPLNLSITSDEEKQRIQDYLAEEADSLRLAHIAAGRFWDEAMVQDMGAPGAWKVEIVKGPTRLETLEFSYPIQVAWEPLNPYRPWAFSEGTHERDSAISSFVDNLLINHAIEDFWVEVYERRNGELEFINAFEDGLYPRDP